ncbi:hypothetical protein Q7P37_002571 [Cladosporium fusiforme]
MAKGRKRGASASGRSRGKATATRGAAASGRGRGGGTAARGRGRGGAAAASRGAANAQTSTRVTRQSAAQAPTSWTVPNLNDDPEAILRRARRAAARARPARAQTQQPAQTQAQSVPQAPPAPPAPIARPTPQTGETTAANEQPAVDERHTEDQDTPPTREDDTPRAQDESKEVEDLLKNVANLENSKDAPSTQSSGTKRQAEDGPEDSNATKKVKVDSGPCQELAKRLDDLKTQHGHDLTGPAVAGEDMNMEVILQALAAVTEAINKARKSRGQSVLFSLFHPNSMMLGNSDKAPVVYPRHDALLPIHRGGGIRIHFSLAMLCQIGTERFAITHLDSDRTLRRAFSEPGADQPTRNCIVNSGWTGNHPNPDDLLERRFSMVTQLSDHRGGSPWAAGIHVILNGWAFAFGWKLSQDAQVDRGDFYTTAADLINLAIQGHLDQATILAFFNCYNYIQPDQVADTLGGRTFDQGTTVAFDSRDDLGNYVMSIHRSGESVLPEDAVVSRAGSTGGGTRPQSNQDRDNESPATSRPTTRLDELMNLNAPVHVPNNRTDDVEEDQADLVATPGELVDEFSSLDEEPFDDDEEEEDRKEKEEAPTRDRYDWRGRLIPPVPVHHSPIPEGNPFHWVSPADRQPQQPQQPQQTQQTQEPSHVDDSVQLDDPEDNELFGDDEDDGDDEDLYSGTFRKAPPGSRPATQDPSPTTPTLALPPLPPSQNTSSQQQQPSVPLPSPASPQGQSSFSTSLPGLPQSQQGAPVAPMLPTSAPAAVEEASSPAANDLDETGLTEQREAEAEAEQAYTANDFGQEVQDDQEGPWVPGDGENDGGNESTLVKDFEDNTQY